MENRGTKIKIWVGICLIGVICVIYFKNVYGKTIESTEERIPIIYEIVQDNPGGEEGYYVEFPKVKLVHRDTVYVTVAELRYEDGSKMSTVLKTEGEERELTEWREGKNILIIWMENGEGEVLEETKAEYIYLVDTKSIQIELQAENGFSGWHNSAQHVTVQAQEGGSGIAYIRCSVNGNVVKEEKNDRITFEVTNNSDSGNGVKIEVEARDIAGHVSRAKEFLYIDTKPPILTIQGVKNSAVRNQDVTLKIGAADHNILLGKSLKVELEHPNGKKTVVLDEWNEEITFKGEGRYHLVAAVNDAAGNRMEQKLIFIIDKTRPEILKISDLNGVYMQKFIPDFRVQDIVKDISDYKCEIFMDGNPYDLKASIKTEGEHHLYVKATDIAGNFSELEAVFYIDRTKPEIIIEGVNDKAEYTDNAGWSVRLKNRGDRIVGIWINGEKYKWKDRYQVKELGTYEILVRAVDAAGNRSVKEIHFSLKEMPKMEQKYEVPFKKGTGIGFHSGKAVGSMSGNVEKEIRVAIMIIAVIVCAAGVSVWLWHKKSSHKREDAK